MMRLVLPRENPRPDRNPGEIQRCGERARVWAAQGTELGDEGKHRARLYAMHCFGALPRTSSSTQVSYRSPRRQQLGSLITLRLLSKRNPLCWAFVWLRRRMEGGTNFENKKE